MEPMYIELHKLFEEDGGFGEENLITVKVNPEHIVHLEQKKIEEAEVLWIRLLGDESGNFYGENIFELVRKIAKEIP